MILKNVILSLSLRLNLLKTNFWLATVGILLTYTWLRGWLDYDHPMGNRKLLDTALSVLSEHM